MPRRGVPLPWQSQQLPAEQLHALLESVQPLLKPTQKEKTPPAKPAKPAKSSSAGASSSKRRRKSKGEPSDDEDDGDEEGGEEEPAHSSAADAGDGRALEAALLTLNVLTVPQIPRELFVEESLEGVLQVGAPDTAPHAAPRHLRLTFCRPPLASCASTTWR